MSIEKEIDRVLMTLRAKIRERGFTQREIQETLGWGRGSLTQLLAKQKQIRLEHLLLILGAIEVSPGDFFSELYSAGTTG